MTVTAVDTSVILDVFLDDPDHRSGSLDAIRRWTASGRLVASDVVWAEVIAAFPDPDRGLYALSEMPIAFDPVGVTSATRAGSGWQAYRRGGGPRRRILADFLIGAHAMLQADQLLTRDRGFYRRAFEGLRVVDPSVR